MVLVGLGFVCPYKKQLCESNEIGNCSHTLELVQCTTRLCLTHTLEKFGYFGDLSREFEPAWDKAGSELCASWNSVSMGPIKLNQSTLSYLK